MESVGGTAVEADVKNSKDETLESENERSQLEFEGTALTWSSSSQQCVSVLTKSNRIIKFSSPEPRMGRIWFVDIRGDVENLGENLRRRRRESDDESVCAIADGVDVCLPGTEMLRVSRLITFRWREGEKYLRSRTAKIGLEIFRHESEKTSVRPPVHRQSARCAVVPVQLN